MAGERASGDSSVGEGPAKVAAGASPATAGDARATAAMTRRARTAQGAQALGVASEARMTSRVSLAETSSSRVAPQASGGISTS
jgi:hypothetical protein